MEHRLRMKHILLNSDTDGSNDKNLKEKKHKSGVTLKWAIPNNLSTEARNSDFQKKNVIFTTQTLRQCFPNCVLCSDEGVRAKSATSKMSKVVGFVRKILCCFQSLLSQTKQHRRFLCFLQQKTRFFQKCSFSRRKSSTTKDSVWGLTDCPKKSDKFHWTYEKDTI